MGDDSVYGGGGNDFVQGNAGNDLVQGGAGENTLRGGKDQDTLIGGQNSDSLYGGKGNDSLTGGAGADGFYFRFDQDGSFGVDTLTDFNRIEEDKILLRSEDFRALADTLTGGNNLPADEFAVISNFNPKSEGNNEAAIIYDPVNGLIYYDPKSPLNDAVKIAQVDKNIFDVNNPLEDTDFEIF